MIVIYDTDVVGLKKIFFDSSLTVYLAVASQKYGILVF